MFNGMAQITYLYVSYYLVGFSLLTIFLWAGRAFLWGAKWRTQLRDAVTYFATICVLALVLALHPENYDATFWRPISWFCFSMLLVVELLWISFLLDQIVSGIRAFFSSLVRRAPLPHTAHMRSGWPDSYPR